MDPSTLHHLARERAESLPGSVQEYPFGPDHEVYKVGGKVFMILGEHSGTAMASLKSHPDDALALREAHDCITPGYHLNKKHWISVYAERGELDEGLLDDLVTESYLLVVETLPRAKRPVDPRAFALRQQP
ncbi:MmcQ/YjbR family DNA-binding protein [Micrococcales bacterium 31B]|nr:MmcQ/YjbR family DNA-binding protein [Micrococcales bacterium 31B]